MADPVSLVLSIAPLLLSAVKGFKAVRSMFKILCSHDRVLRRLRRRFAIQSHVFLDECHLLLQQVVGPDDVVFMLDHDESDLWNNPSLDGKLKKHLGRKMAEREVMLTTAEKAREAFDIMSNKAEYESDIDHLKELNHEFKRLRKMAKEVESGQTLAKSQGQKQVPKEYRARGEYAKSFYIALRDCWSCTEVEHAEHHMALALEWGDGYDMHIILNCGHGKDLSVKGSPIGISVQPQVLPPERSTHTVSCVDSFSILPNNQRLLKRSRVSYKEEPEKPPSPLDDTSRATVLESLTEVSFGTIELRQTSALSVRVNVVKKPDEPIDLRKSYNVCGTLIGLRKSTGTPKCFIDTPDIRHTIAIRSAVPCSGSGRTAVPLLKILERGQDVHLGLTQQLRLVLQLAKGHLQLHWTPWWRQYWSLSDLSYFTDSGTADLGNCLETLHIGKRLDFETLHFDASTFSLTPEVETEMLTHGIRNLSLYCLGIALLQIGRWDALADATDDVVVVRRLAARNGRLGPRYQALTQKCIECDFGVGSDLGNPQLQGSIYESVVCELESLIEVLEKM
ncbi:hypothetical protein F4825DRAFT_473101 [Nemania diffusa]|nr:hypothetical protein F4825DRAFT_473101 [Nemania diffusa]